ncbi:replication initiator [Mycolicibacter arupensis]|uniref:replication initiator n=1 Tax=Mycolicibacter arupensis TaxID=342002 RepID=UPI00122C8673|nr:replication initiator [Mycolicibacter arupensis]KAA1430271.1 plasmid replication initiator protein [Mycolicibacter arupensis]
MSAPAGVVGGPVITLPGLLTTTDPAPVITQMVRRASSPGFETWWRRVESVGYCAHPIQLVGAGSIGRRQVVWTRCNNRRATVCPSCSDLYARDTWQLVHAGAAGGHHNMPAEVAARPQVFATLTAPSYGTVHNATGARCRPSSRSPGSRCIHGNTLRCNIIHSVDDPIVGQPLCGQCYDYFGHVLFTWHLPELWRRFTIALRRAVAAQLRARGMDRGSVRVSFVKVVELQARAVPHIHALIRLDPPSAPTTQSDQNHYGPAAACGGGEPRSDAGPRGWVSPITAGELATLIQSAARQIRVDVLALDGEVRELGFGTQIDVQPLSGEAMAEPVDTGLTARLSPRRVAAYLAKYVTKSLQDFGITARRLSTEAIATLDVSEHVRAILTTIAELAERVEPMAGIGRWLHTLGYRGHITTKSRHYSTTMGALRAARATWTRTRDAKHVEHKGDMRPKGRNAPVTEVPADVEADQVLWKFDHAGHTSAGERTLVYSAALQRIHTRRIGLVEARGQVRDQHGDPPGGHDG